MSYAPLRLAAQAVCVGCGRCETMPDGLPAQLNSDFCAVPNLTEAHLFEALPDGWTMRKKNPWPQVDGYELRCGPCSVDQDTPK